MFYLMQMDAFYYLFLVHMILRGLRVPFMCCFSYAEEENFVDENMNGIVEYSELKKLRNRETTKLSVPLLMSQPYYTIPSLLSCTVLNATRSEI